MTAYEVYERGIDAPDSVPVAIPVEDLYGNEGLCAVAVPVPPGSAVARLALSDNRKKRAQFALLAIQHVRQKTERQYEDIVLR